MTFKVISDDTKNKHFHANVGQNLVFFFFKILMAGNIIQQIKKVSPYVLKNTGKLVVNTGKTQGI